MQFRLYDKDFEITDSMLTAGRFMATKVIPIAETAVDSIADIYKVYGTFEYVAENLITNKDELYVITAKKYVDFLHQSDIRGYDYNAEDFLSDYYATFQTFDLDELCKNIIDSYNKLATEKITAEYKRDFRKATRTKIYGSSLGTSAVAGTFNLLNYAAHTVFNAVDGAITDSNIDEAMEKLYEDYETEVYGCTYSDVYNMGILYCAIAGLDDFYIKNWKRAVKIYRAIENGDVPKNKLSANVAQVLYFQPQEKDNYIWAFNLLGDDHYKLTDYAELFEQKDAVKEIFSAMAELEVQKKKKQQELKLKAEKAKAAQKRQEELNRSAVSIFGKDADEIEKKYSHNKFYPIFLDNPNANFDEFARKIYNSLGEFSKYTKHIWSKNKYDGLYFYGHLKMLKEEMFSKFKATPPPDSEVLLMVLCPYSSTILMTAQKIIYVNFVEPPRKYSYEEIKNIRYTRKEGTLTYNDYININGENVVSIEFDEDVVKIFKDIVEIFKLKNLYKKGLFQQNSPSSSPEEFVDKTPKIIYPNVEDFARQISTSYPFDSYVYYNFLDDELQKKILADLGSNAKISANEVKLLANFDSKTAEKFRAALDSYAKIADDEMPLVLFDSTLFGSAKDGFVLTTKGFYSHGIGLEKNFIPYEHLGVAQNTKGKYQIIKINSVEIDTVALKNDDVEKLVEVIRKCREYFTTQYKNSAPPKVETAENLPTKTETFAAETKPSISIEELKAHLRDNFKFNSYVYYNYANDEKAQKKFRAALESYAKLSSDEIPLVLFDSTLFGSAKDGFVLTNKGIHSHGSSEQTFFIPYSRMYVAQGKYITISGKETDTGFLSDDERNKLFNVIQYCKKFFI